MDKGILIQYCAMKKEIEDLSRRIQELDKFLGKPKETGLQKSFRRAAGNAKGKRRSFFSGRGCTSQE